MKLKRFEIENQVSFMPLSAVEAGIAKPAVKKWAYILHDKDVHDDGSPVEPHYHVLIWTGNNPYDTKYVADWFGVEEQFVNRIKSDVGAMEYLTHSNRPDKHQYDKSEVVANFEIEKAIEAEKKKLSAQARLNEILEGIDSGEIRAYNIHDKVSIHEFDTFKRHIDNAFAYRTKKVKGADRLMKCVYIVGESGCGKTTYAKQMAKDKGFSVYVSSGSNDVLDDYEGQDCIILDDLRPSTLGLADLLKMLDNNTASTVKSRYRNKVLECQMIIITTTQPIERFFRNVFENEEESAVQLMRRCEVLIEMDKQNITFKVWQKDSKVYKALPPVPNLVIKQFKPEDMTVDEALNMLEDVLGSASAVVQELRNNSKEYGFDKQVTFAELTALNGDNPFK